MLWVAKDLNKMLKCSNLVFVICSCNTRLKKYVTEEQKSLNHIGQFGALTKKMIVNWALKIE